MRTILQVFIGFIAGGGTSFMLSNVVSTLFGAVFSMFAAQIVLMPVWAALTTFCTCAIIMAMTWELDSTFIGFDVGKKIVVFGGATLGALNAFLISALFVLSLLMAQNASTASFSQFADALFIISISCVLSSTLLGSILGGLVGFHHGRGHDEDPERTRAFDEYLKRRH